MLSGVRRLRKGVRWGGGQNTPGEKTRAFPKRGRAKKTQNLRENKWRSSVKQSPLLWSYVAFWRKRVFPGAELLYKCKNGRKLYINFSTRTFTQILRFISPLQTRCYSGRGSAGKIAATLFRSFRCCFSFFFVVEVIPVAFKSSKKERWILLSYEDVVGGIRGRLPIFSLILFPLDLLTVRKQ